MATRQVHLFATREDLEPVIRFVETAKGPLMYVRCGVFAAPEVRLWHSLLEVEDLGKAQAGNQSLCHSYLVLKTDVDLKIRAIQQASGVKCWAVDQLQNPASIIIKPGGIFNQAFLICGTVGTVSTDPSALELFREFSRIVTMGFRQYGRYFVGPEGLRLHRSGTRLITMHIGEAPEYDLKPT